MKPELHKQLIMTQRKVPALPQRLFFILSSPIFQVQVSIHLHSQQDVVNDFITESASLIVLRWSCYVHFTLPPKLKKYFQIDLLTVAERGASWVCSVQIGCVVFRRSFGVKSLCAPILKLYSFSQSSQALKHGALGKCLMFNSADKNATHHQQLPRGSLIVLELRVSMSTLALLSLYLA